MTCEEGSAGDNDATASANKALQAGSMHASPYWCTAVRRGAYNVGSAGDNDATASADVQEAVARLQVQGLQAGGVHMGG